MAVPKHRMRLYLPAIAALAAASLAVWLLKTPMLETQAERFATEYAIPGGVLVYGHAGEAPTVHAFGHADPHAEAAMPADAVLRIASLSKPLTGEAILRLEAAGRLSLDDPIVQYLPWLAAAADQRIPALPVHALVDHTGGWDRGASFDPIFTPPQEFDPALDPSTDCETLAHALIDVPLDFAPQTAQVYSNYGYCLLTLIVTAASGQPYDAYILDEIAAQLGIASFAFAPPAGAPDAPVHWQHTGDGLARVWDRPRDRHQFARLAGAGGWAASARDYWAFAAAPRDPRLFDAPQGVGDAADFYRLGWHAWTYPDEGSGEAYITHAGFMAGIFSFVARFPDGMTVVALYNSDVPNGLTAFHRLRALVCESLGCRF